jgi:hypothetical protein
MATIRIEDLPPVENLTPEEAEQFMGAGLRTFRPTLEHCEARELMSGTQIVATVSLRTTNVLTQQSYLQDPINLRDLAGVARADRAALSRDVTPQAQAVFAAAIAGREGIGGFAMPPTGRAYGVTVSHMSMDQSGNFNGVVNFTIVDMSKLTPGPVGIEATINGRHGVYQWRNGREEFTNLTAKIANNQVVELKTASSTYNWAKEQRDMQPAMTLTLDKLRSAVQGVERGFKDGVQIVANEAEGLKLLPNTPFQWATFEAGKGITVHQGKAKDYFEERSGRDEELRAMPVTRTFSRSPAPLQNAAPTGGEGDAMGVRETPPKEWTRHLVNFAPETEFRIYYQDPQTGRVIRWQ